MTNAGVFNSIESEKSQVKSVFSCTYGQDRCYELSSFGVDGLCVAFMSLFKDKYRNETTRLRNWDYGNSAAYFITICTQDQEHWFGKIVNKNIELSEIGMIVHREWTKTPVIRPYMNLILDEFVVMPNHFHGIIIIGENRYNQNRHMNVASVCRNATHGVPTDGIPYTNKFQPQSNNLASIIRGFKSAVTIIARKSYPGFAWQGRFHDHIVRNKETLLRIRQYIRNNPIKWKEDMFYS